MKTKLALFVTVLTTALIAAGCATTQTQEEKVSGSYTHKVSDEERMFVLLKNGSCQLYQNGKKTEVYKWKVMDNEVHIERGDGYTGIWTILANGDHILTAEKVGGTRKEIPKERRYVGKKIK
jgi:hypothetical protein